MDKVSKGLLFAALLLIALGIVDFYHYAVTGKSVLEFYQNAETVKRLVNYSLIQGLLKTAAGLSIAVASFLTAKKRKQDR